MNAASTLRLLLTLLLALVCLAAPAAKPAPAGTVVQYRCQPGPSSWQVLPADGKLRIYEQDFADHKVCTVRAESTTTPTAQRWLTFRNISQVSIASEPYAPGLAPAATVWRSHHSVALAFPPDGRLQARLDVRLPIGGSIKIADMAPADFLAPEQKHSNIRNALLTLLFAMGIVSAMFAYALRDSTTGWYTCLTLSLAVLWSFLTGQTTGDSTLAIDYPWLCQQGLLLSYGLSLFFGARFGCALANLDRHSALAQRVVHAAAWLVLAYTTLAFIPALYGPVVGYYNMVALVMLLVLLVPGVVAIAAGDLRAGGLYLAGWAPIVLAWIGILLRNMHALAGYPGWLVDAGLHLSAWGLLPDWLESPHVRPAALLLQAVIYSLALADRARLLRRSRELAAMTDRITGLANRACFLLLGQQQLNGGGEQIRTLVLFDIDSFAAINETLGYDSGDEALREVGQRLRRKLGENTLLARVGGNQFAALIANSMDQGMVQLLAAGIVRQSLTVEGQTLDISLRCGAALHPRHGQDIELLMRRAEIALNIAKQEKLAAQLYHNSLERDQRFQLSLLSALRTAMAQNQLQLYLQPKVDIRDGRVQGAEVLLRWQHPELGMVSPREFLPFAEKTGLIVELTRWMLAQALQLAKEWQRQGYDLRLSLNLSATDLNDPNLPAYVSEYLMHSRANARLLTLEITESEIMQDAKLAIRSMQALRTLGFQLALDDFGTGNSALAYLQSMPVSEIKIDRSFVSHAAQGERGRVLIAGIVALSHTLGLRTVAEGVEDEADWHRVAAAGCDEVQGFFVSPPLPVSEFIVWLGLNQPFVVPEKPLQLIG